MSMPADRMANENSYGDEELGRLLPLLRMPFSEREAAEWAAEAQKEDSPAEERASSTSRMIADFELISELRG
jgi:hypothetical protein